MSTTTTSRPAAIQFSSSEDARGLPVHQEEECDSPPQLKDLSLSLTRTKTSESTSSRTHRRRSSLAALADRLRSRSHSRTRSTSGQLESGDGNGSSSGRNSIDEDYQFKYTNRRSSDFTGAYADVARAQALFMEKLREEQERKNIRKNADGMPIPPPMHRRRSSVTQILGMDKPLLAR